MTFKHKLLLLIPTLLSLFFCDLLADTVQFEDKQNLQLVPKLIQVKGKDYTIEQRMNYYGVPGASIAIVRDRRILWSQTYGVKDFKTKQAVDQQTLFQAASISKPVTAIAALKLNQQGRLDFSQPANNYLKSWQIPKHKYQTNSPVLVQHLINHTSGLSVHGFAGYQSNSELPTLVEVLQGANWIEQLFSLKKANSAAVEVQQQPGLHYSYSGGGYTVLQQLLEDLTASNFDQLMRKEVLNSLNMASSSFQQPLQKTLAIRAATGYPKNNTPVDGRFHIYPEQAAAGLWTTAEDLAKVIIEIQSAMSDNSGKVLTKQSAEKMTQPSINKGTGFGIFLQGANDKDNGYFVHGGWNEGFSSALIGHKSDGYGIVILTNANRPAFNNEIAFSFMKMYNWLEI